MTAVLLEAGTGPRTHAFVVGVGHYPHCAELASTTRAGRLAQEIGPLTTAPASALAVAQWLLDNMREDPVAPLGSLEVLISAQQPAVVDAIEVEAARFDNTREAFWRWKARCDTNERNVALFYFCGHGWERSDQVLLLEDLGVRPHAFFENAVNFRRTYLGMRNCRALTLRNP